MWPRWGAIQLLILVLPAIPGLSLVQPVSNWRDLWAALGDDQVAEVLIVRGGSFHWTQELVLGAQALQGIQRSSNVTLSGAASASDGSLPELDFGWAVDRIRLAPGVTLAFQDLVLVRAARGLAAGVQLIGPSPGAVVHTHRAIFLSDVCRPRATLLGPQPRAPPGFEHTTQLTVPTGCPSPLPELRPHCRARHAAAWSTVGAGYAMAIPAPFPYNLGTYVLYCTSTYHFCRHVVSDACAEQSGMEQCAQLLMEAEAQYELLCAIGATLLAVGAVLALPMVYVRLRRRPSPGSPGAESRNAHQRGKLLEHAESPEKEPEVRLGLLIGAGSFGRVYKGTWGDQEVAVKVLDLEPSTCDEVLREAALAASMDHPNVVTALHCAVEEAAPCVHKHSTAGICGSSRLLIVQEFCEGGTLCRGRRHTGGQGYTPLDMRYIVRCCREVVKGMMYLHSRHICHGDLKADNVLVGPNDTVKIADFGLSRALGDNTHIMTHSMGSVTHMAPEVLRHGQVSLRSDVYAFGCLMAELTTSAPLYRGMLPAVVLHGVAYSGLRPTFHSEVPTWFVEIAADCWATDPAKRPSFAQILRRFDLHAQQPGLGADCRAADWGDWVQEL